MTKRELIEEVLDILRNTEQEKACESTNKNRKMFAWQMVYRQNRRKNRRSCAYGRC